MRRDADVEDRVRHRRSPATVIVVAGLVVMISGIVLTSVGPLIGHHWFSGFLLVGIWLVLAGGLMRSRADPVLAPARFHDDTDPAAEEDEPHPGHRG